ncbi:MAG: type II secretion system protein GspN [Deltaproteobacteria bacterium]|nr:type II secretion system protein GspN [Deltaproteobacteria bacterium]
MEKDRKILLLKAIGYPIFFIVCVAVFFPMALPMDQIKGLVQKELEGSAGYRIEAGQTGAGLLGGLTFKDVAISAVGADPKAAKLKVEELRITLPILGMLTGRKGVKFAVKGFDGSVSGTIGAKETRQDLDLSVDSINLARLGMLWESMGVKFIGRVSGEIDLTYDTKDAKKDDGSVKIALSDLVLTEGKFMGFDLPKMNFGKVQARFEIKDGKAEVKEFKGKGKDIEVKGEGTSNLSAKITATGLNIKLKFKPSDEFVQKNQKLQPLLFAIQSSKDKEGFYSYQITGPLERPHFSQAPGGK